MNPLIARFNLKPHPEGGYYSEVYRSSDKVSSPRHGQARNSLTHIYFLLERGQISRFHRVRHDEVWNFYAGAPLRLILIESTQTMQLEQQYQTHQQIIGTDKSYVHVIPAEHWQAAETTGDYSFVGCSVAPGFDFDDFSFMQHREDKAWIKLRRPDWQRFI
jgi:hypothetical protein